MELFFTILLICLVPIAGIFIFLGLQKLESRIKQKNEELKLLRFELLKNIREISKQIEIFEKSSNELKSNSDFINNFVYISLVNMLPFKKLKAILLLNELIKKIL